MKEFLILTGCVLYVLLGAGYMIVRAQETYRTINVWHFFFWWAYVILEMFSPEEF